MQKPGKLKNSYQSGLDCSLVRTVGQGRTIRVICTVMFYNTHLILLNNLFRDAYDIQAETKVKLYDQLAIIPDNGPYSVIRCFVSDLLFIPLLSLNRTANSLSLLLEHL